MSSPPDWLLGAVVENEMSKLLEKHQGRPFLRTDVAAKVGQRLDLQVLFRNHMLPFQRPGAGLSGEVVEVKDFDPENYVPMAHERDANGSRSLSAALGFIFGRRSKSIPDGMTFLSSASEGDGYLFMSRERWETMAEEELPTNAKLEIVKVAKSIAPIIHGQEIVCEGCLHFDHDIRRGSEDGPWADGIPFDGRDVWQFTLVYNENYKTNKWVLKNDSFVNLGPSHRPRCWPWNNEDELPYKRTGEDSCDLLTNYDLHNCIGQFGCKENDCSHDFCGGSVIEDASSGF